MVDNIIPDFTNEENYADPVRQCFVEMLRNLIICGNKQIPIITGFSPKNEANCITVDLMPGLGLIDKQSIPLMLPLPENHPYYDPLNPNELYPQGDRIITYYIGRVGFNIWATSKKAKDCIVRQLLFYINLASTGHHFFCEYYNRVNFTCEFTGNECDARTVKNLHSTEGKCPYCEIEDDTLDTYRGGRSLYQKYNVNGSSVSVKTPIPLDDLSLVKPLYRYEVEATLEYVQILDLPQPPLCDLTSIEETIE